MKSGRVVGGGVCFFDFVLSTLHSLLYRPDFGVCVAAGRARERRGSCNKFRFYVRVWPFCSGIPGERRGMIEYDN